MAVSLYPEREAEFLADFAAYFLSYSTLLMKGDEIKAFDSLEDSFAALTEFKEKIEEDGFICLVSKHLMKKLVHLAFKHKQVKADLIEKLAKSLSKYFMKNQAVESMDEMLYLSISMIRVYLELHTYRQIHSYINWINTNKHILRKAHKLEQITYNYYAGRFLLMEMNVIEALKLLSKAYNDTPQGAKSQRRSILMQLIPLKMLTGVTPTTETLVNYDLTQFIPLIDAFREGNIAKFEKAEEDLQDTLISTGTLIIVAKSKLIVFRNLLRRLLKALDIQAGVQPQIPFESFNQALRLQYKQCSLEESNIILCTLFSKKLISGMMVEQSQVFTLSKKMPFPPIEEKFEENLEEMFDI